MFVRVAAGIIVRDGEIFLAKRTKEQHQGGLWEFPGGKCESHETPEQALVRELQEEVGITPLSPKLFEEVEHDYGDKRVCLYFFLVDSFEGEAKGNEGQLTAWFDSSELANLDFPAANKVIVKRLLNS